MNDEITQQTIAAELASGRFPTIVVDFDHTLFLDNSTERFLDAVRPRLLAYLVVSFSDWILQVLAWFGWIRFDHYRDYVRVLLCIICMPWSLWLWRRAAQHHARTLMNHALLSQLRPEHKIIILSYGFHPIIHPLLYAAGLNNYTLVCSKFYPWGSNLRVAGKLNALEKVLPRSAWDQTVFITDSQDDTEIIKAIPHSYLVQWCPLGTPAFQGWYVPFRYTLEGKYPNSRYFTYQIVLEDLALLWMAYAFSFYYMAALTLLFFSLYCIYERGYYDNDHVAPTYESEPVISEQSRSFLSFPKVKPWLWAACFALVGIFLARPEYTAHLWRLKWAFLLDFTCWGLLLGIVFFVFWVFNRRPPQQRIFIFPLLHVFKTFSFAMMIPLTMVGALLLTAQVLSISRNYFIYRRGGDWRSQNRHAWRLGIFLLLVFGLWLVAPRSTLDTRVVRWAIILLWSIVRSLEQAYRKNIVRLILEACGRR